ncbi:MAG: protein kinase domain-containing protein [Planctomycetota bacterium]
MTDDHVERLARALTGQYEILSQAGSGGMSLVYRARDVKHARDVALKILQPEVAAAVGPARFLREIQIAAGLAHPNILALYDSGEADGLLYYAMPFVEGATLQDRIRQDGPLPVEEALAIARDVGEALDFAHGQGVLHRDVKPGNILMLNGRAVLADFGLATAVQGADEQRLTQSGMALGTPAYMSPEQAGGGDVDGRSDQYGLACVVYEMLAGDPPFSGSSARAVLARHVSDPVPSLRSVRPQAGPGVQRVLEKGLAKVPADRYGSVGAFVDALHAPPRVAAGRKLGLTAVVIVAVLAGALWTLEPWATSAPLKLGRSARVTFDAGPEYSGALSPDSKQLAYSRAPHGSMDLYVRPREGGTARRLTDGPGDELVPRWSSDGSTIAFVADRDDTYAIYSISPETGEQWMLVETGLPLLEAFWDAQAGLGARPWSHDDRLLLFSRRQPGGEIAIAQVDTGTRDVTVLTRPSDGARDHSASWSFDGTRIVFSRTGTRGKELWIHDVASSTETELLADDRFSYHYPSFMPGDRFVLFRTARSGNENIWVIEVETKELTQLTVGGGNDWYPNVTADGVITYTQFSHQTDLHEFSLVTGESRRLTEYTMDNFAAAYSPDGAQIAYHSTRTGNAEIWILDRESGAEKNLSNDPAQDLLPAWRHDGREIAFLSNREGRYQLWIADVESGQARRCADIEVPLASEVWAVSLSIRWTPDGRSIGFVRTGKEGASLWTVDVDGSNVQALLPGVLRFDWYGDRHRIVYTTAGESDLELRATDLRTGEDVLLYTGPHTEMILNPKGTDVALLQSRSHFNQNLFRLRLQPSETGLPTAVGELERLSNGEGRWHVHNGSWSPDGEHIVYTQDTDDGDIHMILNDG